MKRRILLIDISVVPITLPTRAQRVIHKKLLLEGALRRFRLPGVVCPPIPYSRGLLTLAARLKSEGFAVAYIVWPDPMDRDRIPVLAKSADVVGITCMTSGHSIAANVAREVREANSKCSIVLGGPHAAVGSGLLDQIPTLDAVVLGAGHPALVNIAISAPALDGIPGVSTRKHPCATPQTESYAEAPMPAYELLSRPIRDYQHSFRTYHGCPYDCSFCAEARTSHAGSSKPLEAVFEELDLILPSLSWGSLIEFSDPIFTLIPERATIICDWLEKNARHLYLSLDMRVDRLTASWVTKLRKAGFRYFRVGIESLTQRVLDTVAKRVKVDQTYEALENIWATATDVMVHAYWITGLPGSTRESLEQDVANAVHLVRGGFVDILSNKVLVPYPSTACYLESDKFGLKLLNKPWNAYDRLSPPVYRLEGLSSQEIYDCFLRTEETVADALQDRIERDCPDIDTGSTETYKAIAYLSHFNKTSPE